MFFVAHLCLLEFSATFRGHLFCFQEMFFCAVVKSISIFAPESSCIGILFASMIIDILVKWNMFYFSNTMKLTSVSAFILWYVCAGKCICAGAWMVRVLFLRVISADPVIKYIVSSGFILLLPAIMFLYLYNILKLSVW